MRPILKAPPLSALVLLLTGLSAAASAFQSAEYRQNRSDPSSRTVATGRITGTREVQRVVVWKDNGVAQLGVETAARRLLWKTDDNSQPVVDSVRVSDLDGDGIPEIISLWLKDSSSFGTLKIFHWNALTKTFQRIPAADNANDLLGRIRRYDIASTSGHKRILMLGAFVSAGRRTVDAQFELRSGQLVRVDGGTVKMNLESGVEGQAVLSPSHPGPIRQGEKDSAPYKTTIVVRDASTGKEVTQIETDAEGRFRIKLPPGTYTISGPQRAGRFLPRAGEENVTVEPGKYARITIHFDSGMR